MSKTIDFMKCVADMKSTLPMDKKTLREVLKDISKNEEVFWGYVDHCAKLINDISLWRDIFNCISTPQRCQSLIDSLDEDQQTNFSRVLIGIKEAMENDDVQKLVNATFNLETPTETTIKKAMQLIESIKKIDEKNLEYLARELFQLSNHFRCLGGIFYNFNRKKSDDQWPISLAQLSEHDFDELIRLNNSLMVSKGYSFDIK